MSKVHHTNNAKALTWSERNGVIKGRSDDGNVIFLLRVGKTFDIIQVSK